MDESSFEGTLVLEMLAEIGKLDEFFEAIDADNFGIAQALMKDADVDMKTIAIVMHQMTDGADD
jgi:ABC-type Mn2+/Zn2+ transport system ATPase subunit